MKSNLFPAPKTPKIVTSKARGKRGAGAGSGGCIEPLEARIAPATTVTLTGVLAPGGDTDGDGVPDPGEKMRYTATVDNSTGAGALTAMSFTELLNDANLTLVPGSVNVSPLAIDDTFTAIGNTSLVVGTPAAVTGPAKTQAGSVTGNDFEFLTDTIAGSVTITAFDATTTQGGTVSMVTSGANMGSFSYLPAAGFTGTDTFTYTLTDASGLSDAVGSKGTVTITVANRVWYVDDSAAAGGDGRSNTPFNAINGITVGGPGGGGDADQPNDTIFLYAGNYTSAFVPFDLEAGQTLHGEGTALVVGGFTLVAAGTAPVLTSSGTMLNLGSNNTLTGLTLGNAVTDISGSGFGTLTVSNVQHAGTGAALALTNGTLAATFNSIEVTSTAQTGIDFTGVGGSLTVTGATTIASAAGNGVRILSSAVNAGFAALSISSSAAGAGIFLQNHTGSFTTTGGAISGIGGVDVNIDGGTGAISIASSITNTAGGFITINNHETGNVTFSGVLSSVGASAQGISVQNSNSGTIAFSNATKTLTTNANVGVLLLDNTGAAVNFTGGGLAITTTGGTGFQTSFGGTITVQGAGNTINSVSATALNVANTTIAAAGLNFLSISAGNNTAAADPANGIVLNNTGASGGLTVTGDGGGSNNGSGGTIQNTTGVGVSLTTTRNGNLNYMTITGSGDDGISGTSVTGFTMNRSNVTNNGNALNEDGVDFGGSGVITPNGLFGTASVTNSVFTGNYYNQFTVRNSSGTVGLTMTGATITGRVAENNNNDGLFFESLGTATITGNVQASAFSANKGDHFQAAATNSGNLNVTFKGNTLTGGHSSALGQGITINAALGVAFGGYTGTVNYDIDGNTINGAISNGIIVNLGTSGAAGTFNGFIRNNIIGTAGVALSGSTQANGIAIDAHGNGTHTSAVTGNTLFQCFDRGISVLVNDGTSGVLNLTVQGNDLDQAISNDPAGSREAFFLNNGSTTTNVFGQIDAGVVRLDFGGAGALANDLTHGVGAPDDFRIRQRFQSRIEMPGYNNGGDPFAPAPVVAYIQGRNTGSAGEPGSATSQNDAGSTNDGFFATTGAVPLPTPTPLPLFFAPSAPEELPPVEEPSAPGVTPPSGQAPVVQTPVIVDDGVLSQAELDSLVGAAIARWETAGLSAAQVGLLRSVNFTVADLSGRMLGEAGAGVVTLDANAAGNAWFIDPTPMDDAEYESSSGVSPEGLRSWAGSPSHGRVDALTTVMHELGHQLGLDDLYAGTDSADLMYGYLHQSERRRPAAGEAAGAMPGGHVEEHALQFSPDAPSLGAATLPVGEKLTIVYDGTINAALSNGFAPQVSSQIRVSHSGGNVDSNTVSTQLDGITLGNLVFDDANQNGAFDSATELGINGVTMRLYADNGTTSGSFDAGDTLISSATTAGAGANAGTYTFAGLLPGDYIVQVAQSNFNAGGALVALKLSSPGQPDPDNDTDNDDNGAKVAGSGAVSLAITLSYNGEVTADGTGKLDINNTLDFGFIPPATAGDRLWYDLDGDGVQDASEGGLNGVTLELLDSGSSVIGTTTTSGNGNYLFGDLDAGTYSVRVVGATLPGGNVQTYDLDGTGTAHIATFTLTGGQNRTDVDFGYRGTGSIGDRLWMDFDGDGVQDAGEPGLNGATVELLDGGATVIGSTTTSGSGNYTFANLLGGSYSVRVVSATLPAGVTQTYDLDGIATAHIAGVTLAAAQMRTDADFGYRGAGSVGDRVWNDADADGVQDGGETGFNGVTVELLDGGASVIATGVTSGDGNYSFPGLLTSAGGLTYSVRVVGATLPAGANPTYDLDGTGTPRLATFTLTDAAPTRSDVDFGDVVGDVVAVATLNAGDETADESGDTGLFTFTRFLNTGTLVANFQLDAGSTASAADFGLTGAKISYTPGTGAGTVTFDPGVTSVTATLAAPPEALQAAEAAETVRLNIVPSAGVYAAGSPSNATVTITQNGFIVTTIGDAGEGSLRQAIANADALTGTDTITFGGATFTDATPDTILLTSGQLVIASDLKIQGSLAAKVAVSGGGVSRVLFVDGSAGALTVGISDLKLTGGNGVGSGGSSNVTSGNAGGLLVFGATLNMIRCEVSGNNAATNVGGGIMNGGVFTAVPTTLNLVDSLVEGNTAPLLSGGIYNPGASTLNIINSTISGNMGPTAAVHNNAGNLTIDNSTITGNRATAGSGGGIHDAGNAILRNTIVAGNFTGASPSTTPGDITGTIETAFNNLIGDAGSAGGITHDADGNPATGSNNIVGVNGAGTIPIATILAPLADAGGPTFTHALVANSPALNAGNAALMPADTFDLDGDMNAVEALPVDQRGVGFNRVVGTGLDIGAFELGKVISIAPLDATKSEGTGGATTAFTFTVSRIGDTTGDATVNYQVSGPGANAADFGGAFPSGMVTILNGQTSATLTINVSHDTTVEAGEDFTVTLSNPPASYVLGTTAATGTINDDDMATVSIAKANDGAETNTPVNGKFTVTQTAISSTDTVLTYTIGGTATAANNDIAPLSGTVTILAGQTTADIDVTVLNDHVVEATEDVMLTLNGFGAHDPQITLGAPLSATLDITDDDTATVSIAKFSDAAEPGTTGKFRVTQSLVSSTNTVVSYTIGGTATAGAGNDYTALSGSVTIMAGQMTADIDVAALNDALVEGTETVSATLGSVTGGDPGITVGASDNASLDLTDNDTATLSITPDGDAPEQGGAKLFNVTLTTSDGAGGTATLAPGISLSADVVDAGGGTAISGTDYSAFGTQMVTFAAGSGNTDIQSVTLTPINDSLLEATETVKLKLQNLGTTLNGQASLGNVGSTLNIQDNESATVSIVATANVTEGGGAQNVGVTLIIAGDAGGTAAIGAGLTVTADVVDAGTGTAVSGTDYEAFGTQTVTFSAGDTTGTVKNVSVTPKDDMVVESNKTVDLTLQNLGANADVSLGTTGSVVTINDDDGIDLRIGKAGNVGSLVPGGLILYTLSYRNAGFVTANGVSISDSIPANTVFDLANSTAGWTDSMGNPLTDGAAAGTVAKFAIGSLPVSASTFGDAILAVRVINSVPAGANTISNTATIEDTDPAGDINSADNTAILNTPLTAAPDLVVTSKSDGTTITLPGAVLTYTINYRNNGNQDATGVVLTETLPAGSTIHPDALAGGWVPGMAPGTFVFTVGALAGGGTSGSAPFKVTVDNPVPPGQTTVVNSVIVADDGTNGLDPTPANNTATDTDFLIAPPGVGINIVSPFVATYTDVDGDLVMVRVSKPILDPLDFQLAPSGLGYQLVSLLFSDDVTPRFNLTIGGRPQDVTNDGIKDGNGLVNVGRIDAAGIELGAVTLSGDLGEVDAGKGAGIAIQTLRVGSLGKLGTTTGSPDLHSSIDGTLGTLAVGGDVVDAHVDVTGNITVLQVRGSLVGGTAANSGKIHAGGSIGAGDIAGDVLGGSGPDSGRIEAGASLTRLIIRGSLHGGTASGSGSVIVGGALHYLTIRGDLIGGTSGAGTPVSDAGSIQAKHIGNLLVEGSIIGGTNGGGGLTRSGSVHADDDISAMIVKGNILGSQTAPVLITARGQGAPPATGDLALRSLTVDGNVVGANIQLGFDKNSVPRNADAQLNAVVIGGDWIASNLRAGVDAVDGQLGDANDTRFAPGPGVKDTAVFSRLASIVIKGSVSGTAAGVSASDRFGFAAEHVGAFKVNGIATVLAAGARSDTFALAAAKTVGAGTSTGTPDGFEVHVFEV